ncbi:MAG: ROK family protein [Verrucomicrobiota bacterium]
MKSSYVLGIDWGGTRIKWGAYEPGNGMILEGIFDSNAQGELAENVAKLFAQLETGCLKLGTTPKAIGLALTGVVDPQKGVVMLPGKVRGLEGYPIVGEIGKHFGVPTVADNDGRAAMLAEWKFGAARGCNWAVVLTIGTGVGSGVLLDGKILRDRHLQFGTQLGHLVLDASADQLCLTGVRGSGEIFCSATALALAVRSALQRGLPSSLSELYARDPRLVDFKAIIEQGVALGDTVCMDELARWTRQLGWLLVNAVHAYAPEIIVLGGGAMLGAEHFLPALQAQVNSHLFRYPKGEPIPVVVSELCENAGVLGACSLALDLL